MVMVRHLGALCATAFASIVITSSAQAATVTVSQIVDLSNIADFPTDITLAEGDSLDWTVRFSPGQSVTVNDLVFIFPIAFGPAGGSAIQYGPTETLDFLDASGAAIEQLTFSGSIIGKDIAGLFSGMPTPSSRTFSGIRFTVGLQDYLSAGVTSETFTRGAVQFRGSNFDTADLVPEPSTWAMLIVGMGMVGAGMRMRQRAGVPAA